MSGLPEVEPLTRRAWFLFASLALIWGVPYLLIRVAVAEISPPLLVFGRTAIGAGLLLPAVLRRGHLRRLLPRWRAVAAFIPQRQADQAISHG